MRAKLTEAHCKIKYRNFAIKFTILIANLIVAFSFANAEQSIWSAPKNCSELNSTSDDFAPSYSTKAKKLYYNSIRKSACKIYETRLDSINPKESSIAEEFGDANYAPSFLSFLGESVYLSSFNLFDSRSFLNINKSDFKDNRWTKSYPINQLVDPSFNAHASISPNGQTLVFASNRSGSLGGTDLWITHKNADNEWNEPENLRELNSIGDEITPYFSSNDTLFFASNGFAGKGGYDIYYSINIDGVWSRPFPFEELNTEFDESDLTIAGHNKLFFASNRPGGLGGLDLWMCEKIKSREIAGDMDATQIETLFESETQEISANVKTTYISIPLSKEISINNIDDAFSKTKFDFSKISDDSLVIAIKEASFNICAERAKLNKNAIFTLELSSKQDLSEIEGLLRKTLSDVYHLDSAQAKIICKKSSNKDILLSVENSDKSLLEPYKIEERQTTLSPNLLSVKIDARPRNLFKNCKLYISTLDSFYLMESIAQTPFAVNISLAPYTNSIGTSETLDLLALFTSTNGKAQEKKLKIDVSRRQSSEPKVEINALRTTRVFYVDSDLELEGELSQIKDFLQSNAGKKKIIATSYGKDGQIYAERLEKSIKNIIPNLEFTIKSGDARINSNAVKITAIIGK